MLTARRPALMHLLVLLLYAGLTVLLLWPLVRDIGSAVIGWEGDNFLCVRVMWWMKHALLDLHASPFTDPTVYYPIGYNTAHGPLLFANSLLGLPFTVLFGPLVSYNLMVLLSFVLTGFGVYLWISHITGSRGAGIVAGTIAAFLPYRFAHSVGHMHMMTTQWMAFALYGFERFRDRPGVRAGLFLGAMLLLVVLSDWYYAYAAALMLPIYALARTWPWRAFWARHEVWRGLALAVGLSLVLVVPFLVPYLRLAAKGGMSRALWESEFWSLNVYDFFTPNRLHMVWGEASAPWFPRQSLYWVELNVMLGFAAIALAIAGFANRRRFPAAPAIVAVWIASYLIALGPTLHSGDRQVIVPVPLLVTRALERALTVFPSVADLRTQIVSQQATPIPLPAFFLYLFVPMTSGMRVMARFGIWTGLMTAGLAGLAVAALLARWRERGVRLAVQGAAVAVIIALVVFESWTKLPMMPAVPRPVDLWLAKQPANTAYMELPIAQGSRSLQDYYQTVHGRNWVFGPGFAFTPAIRTERQALLDRFPAPEAVEALRSWKTTYVLFTPHEIANWPQMRTAIEEIPALEFFGVVGNVWVYRVK